MKKALITLVALLAVTGMASAQTDISANSTESATVDVTVVSQVAVDIQPASLSYAGAQVGEVNTTSDNGFTAIDVENTGSEYINKIWASASTPESLNGDPFGSGSASNYDAGNFMMLRPNNQSSLVEGDTDNFHYVNRVEYLWNTTSSNSDIPSFIQLDDAGTPYDGTLDGFGATDDTADHAYVGRFRAGNEDYYFAVEAGTSGGLSTGNEFVVATDATDDGNLGTVDFTHGNSGNFNTFSLQAPSTNDDGESWFHLDDNINLSVDNSDSNFRKYDVIVSGGGDNDPAKAIRTRYDVTESGYGSLRSDGYVTNYLLYGTQESGMLAPGDAVTYETAIEIPRGVKQGSVDQGTLTFKITADTSK